MNNSTMRLLGTKSRLKDLFLGKDPRLHVPVGRTLLALALYIVSVISVAINVHFGASDLTQAQWLAVYMLAGPAVFYLLIRSGWSLRKRDISLSIPQNVYAITALVLAYPVNGPLRGLNLLLVALLPFFGFLVINPRHMRMLTLFSLLAFGAMMAFLAFSNPTRFNPRIEILQFIIAAICLPCMEVVLGQASRMRAEVRAQRADLQAAFLRIEALATHDELTGLVNRRRIGQRLDEECSRVARYEHQLCIAVIDIDFFKRVNDTLGHAKGDAVLRHFAQTASAVIDGGHELGRWGGEEFLLLLPATNQKQASTILEVIRDRVASSVFTGELSVTFSAGLACGVGQGPEDMLDRADKALYRAKAEGRDRTVCE